MTGYPIRRLRDVAELRVSNVDKHEREGEVPVKLCNYVDVYKNERITDRVRFMPATATPDEVDRFRLRQGDVLITKDSEAWDDIAVPALVEHEGDDLLCGYHLAILRPRPALVSGAFLLRALQSHDVARQFHVAASGVTRFGLSHADINAIAVPVPTPVEQRAIVRFLDHADRQIRRAIRAKQKLISLLNEHKQAVTHNAVTRGLDPNVRLKPSGVDWLGDVPEHWPIVRLKSILRAVDERSVEGAEPLLSLRRDHGIVRFSDHFSRPPQAATTIGYKLVTPGHIVVNRLQANNGLIFSSEISGLISPEYSVFSVDPSSNAEYLATVLRAADYRAHFRRSATGLGTGTAGFLRLYDDAFLRTPFALPPLSEQRKIVSSLEGVTRDTAEAIRVTDATVNALREYRIGLIAEVVTGKLDVRQAAVRMPDEVGEPELVEEGDDDEAADENLGGLEPVEA